MAEIVKGKGNRRDGYDLKGLEWRREQFKGLIEKKWIECDDDVKRAVKENRLIPNDGILRFGE